MIVGSRTAPSRQGKLADIEPKPARTQTARIRIPKTSELVANHFRGQIVRGELQEGDFLPPEGQLMSSLGVSRPTLREAFRILEAESLISVVRGSRTGARVHLPSVDLVSRYAGYVLQSQGTTVADLYEARLAIEPHVVRRLATKADPEIVQSLRKNVEALQETARDLDFDGFYAGVDAFHRLLVELTGNKTLVFMNQMLLHLISGHQRAYLERHARSREDKIKGLRIGVKSYTKLIDLIEAGDVDGALHHWRLHLQNANATWASDQEANRIVDALSS